MGDLKVWNEVAQRTVMSEVDWRHKMSNSIHLRVILKGPNFISNNELGGFYSLSEMPSKYPDKQQGSALCVGV